MEDIIIGVEFDNVDNVNSLIEQLVAEIKELKDAKIAADKAISDSAKKMVADTKKSFDEIKSKYIKLGDNISKVGASIAGAFAAANGAVGIFGDVLGYSAEEMEQAQKQAASYISIVAAVKPLFEGTIAAIELGMSAFKALSAGLKTATTAQMGLNVAMSLNPIGLIVAAIAAAIASIAAITYAIYTFREEIYDVIQAVSEMGIGIKILIGILGGPFTMAIMGTIEVLKYFGVIESQVAEDSRKAMEAKATAAKKETESRISEIRKQKVALEDQIKKEKEITDEKVKLIDYEIKKRQAAGKDTKDVEKDKLQLLVNAAMIELRNRRTILEMLDAELFARRDNLIEYKKLQGENTASLEAELNKEKNARKRIREEDLGEFQDNLQLQLQNLELFNIAAIKSAKDKAAELKKIQDKEEEDRLKVEADRLKAIGAAEEAYRVRQLDADQKKIDDLSLRFEKEMELARDNKDQQLLLEAEFKKDIDKINDETIQKRKDAKDKLDDENAKLELKNAKELAEAKELIYNQYTASVLNLQDTVFSIGEMLGKQDENSKESRAKRQFNIQKALALSLASVDGYKAITASLAQSPVAIGPVPNPAGIASLAFAITNTAASLAKIGASKYNGSNASPSITGSTPTTSMPTNTNSGQQFTLNSSGLSNNNSSNNNSNLNISVSVEEINTVQNRMIRIRDQASLS